MNHKAEIFVAIQRVMPKHLLSRLIGRLAESKIIWLKNGTDEGTDGHVDNIACFIKPGEVIALSCYDKSDTFYDKINENLSLLIVPSNQKEIKITSQHSEWTKKCIDTQLPEVFLSTSEKLVPQMLNLDIDEVGVNFSKGCYPGQEVVARLHYLGEAKRRLFAFECDSEVQIGDNLYCKSSKTAKARGDRYKGSGTVVNTVKYNSKFYCLATLDIELIDEKITINNESGQILTRINNE